MNFCHTARRIGDASKDLEECAFTGTISTNDPDDFTLLDFERNGFECPKNARILGGALFFLKEGLYTSNQMITQCFIRDLCHSKAVPFGEFFCSNRDIAHETTLTNG